MKVYTVTFYHSNYGSVLQAFALQQILREAGLSPVIVKPPVQQKKISLLHRVYAVVKPEKHYGPIKKIRRYIESKMYNEKQKKLNQFIQKNLKIESFDEFSDYIHNNECIFLSGSDQVWNVLNGPINSFYLFQNVDVLPVKKVSYAASVGLADLNDEQIDYFRDVLSDYDVISLRERNMYNIFRENFPNLNVRNDIDPTLLFSGNWWKKFSQKRLVQDDYIFVYMLRPDNSLIRMAKQLARKHNCKVIYTGQFANRYGGVKTIVDAGIEDFLSYILYAKYVITNSFHGTVFSVLFGKRFVNIKIDSTSSRAENLLQIIGLSERMISTIDQLDVIDTSYDVSLVNERIQQIRKESLEYISELGTTS